MNIPHHIYDVFLSYSHADANWVEKLAHRLEDEHALRVWLDKWILTPGKSWQQAMARGLNQAACCAVCIGDQTPRGWFREEIERALDLQTKNGDFRVIPVLIPGASSELIPEFLSLRTWADFGADQDYAFHVLVQGIRGLPVGRWRLSKGKLDSSETMDATEQKLEQLSRLAKLGVHEEVVVEFERKILTQWFEVEQEK